MPRMRSAGQLGFVLLAAGLTLVIACTGTAKPSGTTPVATTASIPGTVDTSTTVAAPTLTPTPGRPPTPSPIPAFTTTPSRTLIPAHPPTPTATLLPPPAPTLGPALVTVNNSSATVDFPDSISFSLDASSALPIETVALEFGTDQVNTCGNTYSTVDQEFALDNRIRTSWQWEFKKSGSIPPGVTVWWRWRITDEAGRRHLTPRQELMYEDLRFDWQRTATGNITIFWYNAGSEFGEEVAAKVDQGVSRLQLGSRLEKPIQAFIYSSSTDVQGAVLFAKVWTAGQAHLAYNTVLLAVSPDRLDVEITGLSHELAHLLVNEATFNCLARLDPWLDEGLAQYSEGPVTPHYQITLDQAIANNELISVRSLSSSFPAAHGGATLSYAQSRSLVQFLIDTYGWEKMRQLLSIFSDGSTTDSALRTVYGFDRDGLNQLWRQHIGAG